MVEVRQLALVWHSERFLVIGERVPKMGVKIDENQLRELDCGRISSFHYYNYHKIWSEEKEVSDMSSLRCGGDDLCLGR